VGNRAEQSKGWGGKGVGWRSVKAYCDRQSRESAEKPTETSAESKQAHNGSTPGVSAMTKTNLRSCAANLT